MNMHEPLALLDRSVANVGTTPGLPRSRQAVRLTFYAALLGADLLALVGGPLIIEVIMRASGWPQANYMPSLAIIPIYLFIAGGAGAYSSSALQRTIESARRALASYAKALMLMLFIAFILKGAEDMSRVSFVASTIATGVLMILGRAVLQRPITDAVRDGLVNELLILDERALGLAHGNCTVVDAARLRLRPDLSDPAMLDRFGRLAKSFDRILISAPRDRHRAWALMLKGADVDGEILVEEANELGAIGIRSFQGHDTLLVSRKPLSLPNRLRKRALDLAVTVPLLIALAPLFVVVAIAVKLDSPGPVLFRQYRVGRGNRLFHVLKFRSMRVEASDAAGTRSASRDDARITRVGRFIRSTSIDELPQLFNVLIGDMSLVGPRPHALGSLAGNRLFWQIDETYWHRHQLKPGITGLAQVRGYRGATAIPSDLTNRLQSDMEYIQDWDIWRDIGILVNTARVIVHRNAF